MTGKEAARRIFHAALQSASIPAAFERHFPALPDCDRIYAIALGKAALPMLEALCAHLPRPLDGGICCAPLLPPERLEGVEYFAGGHPLPNQDSLDSARAAVTLLNRMQPRDLVFFLISGGGSAMCELPLDPNISLAETRSLYQTLVGSGATIAEINTVRKHFSAVKGGRLAALAPHRVSLLISDVAPRHLDALASGPTLQDSSTVAQCREILHRYEMQQHFTPRVRAFFDGPLPETPALTPAPIQTLLSSEDLLHAARTHARALGYDVVIDNHCDDWDYAEAAAYLWTRFRALRREHTRLCLLSGGEVTVRLGSHPGEGGRNQQFTLACALQFDEPGVVLSAGSDGIDGNSPAAGALADEMTLPRARALGLDPAAALARFDAYPFFTALGDTLVTGPTHNNLRDLRLLITP